MSKLTVDRGLPPAADEPHRTARPNKTHQTDEITALSAPGTTPDEDIPTGGMPSVPIPAGATHRRVSLTHKTSRTVGRMPPPADARVVPSTPVVGPRDLLLGSSTTGPVSVRSYGPLTRDRDVLVWVHGGSWAHGSVEAWHAAYVALQASLPLTLIAARYRSSYEAPHPAQLIDVMATLRAVRTAVGDSILIAGGDSAGGTLVAHAASVSTALIDAQILAYPPMDPTCASPTYDDTTEFPSRGWMLNAWAAYAGSATPEGLANASPLAEPLHAGVAPTSLLVGSRDPVRGDVEGYASSLRDAGVATQITVSDDVCHGDFLRIGRNPVRDWIVTATRHHLQAVREGARQ